MLSLVNTIFVLITIQSIQPNIFDLDFQGNMLAVDDWNTLLNYSQRFVFHKSLASSTCFRLPMIIQRKFPSEMVTAQVTLKLSLCSATIVHFVVS